MSSPDRYFNVDGVEDESSFECYTAAVEPNDDGNPRYSVRMVDDLSSAEAQSAPRAHVFVNINGYGLFTTDQARQIIAGLARFVETLEATGEADR